MKTNNKGSILVTIATFVTGILFLTGCGTSQTEETTIRVGASIAPHAEILEVAKPLLEEQGYTLEIVEFTDYVLPNTALAEGDLDANYFQHLPYLEEFNIQKNTSLAAAVGVHFEPLGIYGGKLSDLSQITEGAVIGVPNDTTNEARALLLLEAKGFLQVDDEAGLTATVLDITDNPLNLKIVEIEAAQLVRSLQDLDFACINGNYALEGGLDTSTVLASEGTDSLSAKTYGNIIAVREENLADEKIQALIEAVTSEEVQTFIENTYAGVVVPVF